MCDLGLPCGKASCEWTKQPTCKRCGKPRREWQVFCGAGCSARWESGDRGVPPIGDAK